MHKWKFFLICIVCFFIRVICGYAQETLTITTYYPSPEGSYNEVRANRMALGYARTDACWETTCPGTGVSIADDPTATPPRDIDLIVEGQVGIGTTSPGQLLSLEKLTGDVAIKFRQATSALSYTMGIDNADNNKFKIASGGDFTTPLITVTDTALIGIGQTNPQDELHIIEAISDSTDTELILEYSGSGGGVARTYSIATQNTGMFTIRDRTVDTQRLVIDTNGNVGIGPAGPGTKLHVNDGTIRITGTGSPATGGALCLNASGDISKCTSTVDASGNCTCP